MEKAQPGLLFHLEYLRVHCLGHFFFVIFISDLLEVVMPGNTIAVYADDCKTSRVITCLSDYPLFQSDLDNLYLWSQQNLMDFNIKKM